MSYYITIILIVLSISLNAQTKFNQDLISKSTNKIVKEIEEINELMGSAVYIEAKRPPQYDNFEKLMEIASKEELVELTNHPNGVVRCYAFWALTNDTSVDLFSILINHIEDYEVVETQFGCIGSQEMVGDFLISLATPRYNNIELVKLDSILIYSNSKLNAKSNAINRTEPTESIYPKIRELVVDNNDQSALVALAKFKKQTDISLILKNREESKFEEGGLYYTYKAIQEFPHPDFIPLLEENLNKTLDDTHFSHEWKELYTAIASYKNEKSVEMLEIPFTQVQHDNIRKYHINFVYYAIQLNKCEIYDPLLWKMWEEENRISPDIYNYLMERDSLKAYELTIKCIFQPYKIYSAHISLKLNNLDSKENLISIMLDEILKKDKQLGIEIICENIKDAKVYQFLIFTSKIIDLKDSIFVEPLFERFEKERNPHVYLRIAEILITYQDENINKRILDTRKINDNLNKDWGSEFLNRILKKNNLIK